MRIGVWVITHKGDCYLVQGCRLTRTHGVLQTTNDLVLLLVGGDEIKIASEGLPEGDVPTVSEKMRDYHSNVVRRITQSGLEGEVADLRDIAFPIFSASNS